MFRLSLLAIALLLVAPTGVPASAQQAETATTGGRVDVSPRSVAFEYADRPNLTFGVDGDTRLVFVTEPLARRIAVLDRFLGQQVAEVPAPPGGFLLPFSVRVPGPGRLVVLDPGGSPNSTVPAIARVYDYNYEWNPLTRTFTAWLTRTVSLAGLPVVFAEEVEITESGLYIVAESVIGALWVIRPDGSVAPGVVPSPGSSIPTLGPCTLPPVTVDGIQFVTAGNFAPGVLSLAARDGQLFFGTTCNGGLHRIPLRSLVDPSRTPEQRAQDIVAVSPRPPGTVETFEGLAVNRFAAHDDGVYAADSFNLRILRIDPRTGAREVIASDALPFNFPVRLQFLPPIVTGSPPLLVVALRSGTSTCGDQCRANRGSPAAALDCCQGGRVWPRLKHRQYCHASRSGKELLLRGHTPPRSLTADLAARLAALA